MERNGRASSEQRTRLINVSYFFIKDRVGSDELSIIYCPTDEMIADFFHEAFTRCEVFLSLGI